MTRRFYIDGRDAYEHFGVFVAEGGYNELVAFPPLKEVAGNDWPDEDGREVDLSQPELTRREVTIRFAAHGALRVAAFIEQLCRGSYHTFEFAVLGRSYRLRLLSQTGLELAEGLETFALRLADDFPVCNSESYIEPQSTLVAQSGYELDGRSLAQYGVTVLRGSEAEIRKLPAVKGSLMPVAKVNLRPAVEADSSADGPLASQVVYDDCPVYFQAKDVRLSCLMRARTMDEFWRNYQALLCDLVRPAERMLYVESMGGEFACYYKSCATTHFAAEGRIWFQFDLTLVFTGFRECGQEWLLASELDEWVMTEDGNYAVDLAQVEQ